MDVTQHQIVFDDTFEVISIDSEKFDKVSRIKAKAQTFLADAQIDFNTDIFPIRAKETLSIAIASTRDDAVWETNIKKHNDSLSGLIDEYEYVMFGKIYKKAQTGGNRVSVFASFGGLLMCMEGDRNDLDGLHLDSRIYLLAKRVR